LPLRRRQFLPDAAFLSLARLNAFSLEVTAPAASSSALTLRRRHVAAFLAASSPGGLGTQNTSQLDDLPRNFGIQFSADRLSYRRGRERWGHWRCEALMHACFHFRAQRMPRSHSKSN
jgi:hypothetical protein